MDTKKSKQRHRSPYSEEDDASQHKNHKRRHKEKHAQHQDKDSDHDDRRQKKFRRNERDRQRHQRENSDVKYDPNIRIKQERDVENFERQQRERSQNNSRRRDNHRERERHGGDFGLNTQTQPATDCSDGNAQVKEEKPKERPNFEKSGKLTEDTNTFRGVVIKYNEPPEAMVPKRRWRLYPFKGETALPVLHVHRQSAYLLGRERKIADIPVDHPSCSKQQAVLQFRAVSFTRDNGTMGRRVRPFIIDLESANGTYLNSDKIEARRYYELKEKDVLKFGFSTREYVVLHDSVDTTEVDDGECLD